MAVASQGYGLTNLLTDLGLLGRAAVGLAVGASPLDVLTIRNVIITFRLLGSSIFKLF